MPVEPRISLLVRVVPCLFGLFAGFVLVGGFTAGVHFRRWVGLFLATTVPTSLTDFGFPFVALLPSHRMGALSPRVGPVPWLRCTGNRSKVPGARPLSFSA